ncbi:MAG: hypothetical protein ABSE73_11935 [Planctomycetota bacterium]
MSKSFIEQCLAGEVLPEAIDEFVAKWHNDSNAKESLRDYLGFSGEEYKLWAEQPEALEYILLARKNKVPLREAIQAQSVAAKSKSQAGAVKMKAWLEKARRVG